MVERFPIKEVKTILNISRLNSQTIYSRINKNYVREKNIYTTVSQVADN